MISVNVIMTVYSLKPFSKINTIVSYLLDLMVIFCDENNLHHSSTRDVSTEVHATH